MENNTGNWEDSSQEDSGTIPGPEGLVGWCSECSCETRYHLGSDEGACLYCGCPKLVIDPDSDLYYRLKYYLLPELPPTKDELIQFDIEPTSCNLSYEETALTILHTKAGPITYDAVVFLGRVSRSCKMCGDIKLYVEFNNSRDPATPCRLCQCEIADEALFLLLEDGARAEIEDMEEEIYQNESAIEEAWERQQMIDECLRGLDE